MTRKPRTPFEGSELSRGHGDDRFKTTKDQHVAEVLGTDPEDNDPNPDVRDFLKSRWESYYESHPDASDPIPLLRLPTEIDYNVINKEPGERALGYTVDPFTEFPLDPLRVHTRIDYFPNFRGKPLSEVYEAAKTSGNMDLYKAVPDISYLLWLSKNPDQVPEDLKTDKIVFLPGSIVRGADGLWYAVRSRWDSKNKKIIPRVSVVPLHKEMWTENTCMALFVGTRY